MIGCVRRGAFRIFASHLHPNILLTFAFASNQKLRKKNQKPFSQETLMRIQEKPISSTHKEMPIKEWREELNKALSLQDLLKRSEEALRQSGSHLALFLQKLNPQINHKSFQKHRTALITLNSGVNSLAGSLTLNGSEFIEILRFRGKMRELEGELRFLHNFGFEKKASMLAAGFIHNRELTFSQSVLALSLILPLGGVNMLLLMNFLKYFKEMSSGEQASSVKIEHLLSLLAIKFHKRNEIILQNTLYDHVLHLLLQKMSKFIEDQTVALKIQALCTLLLFDCKHNYRTDHSSKRYWTERLIVEMEGRVESGWARSLWVKQEKRGQALDAFQIVYVLECMAFAKGNMLSFEGLAARFSSFCSKVLSLFEKQCAQMQYQLLKNGQSFETMMRFLFNPLICAEWLIKRQTREMIFAFILKENVQEDKSVKPLSSLISSNLQEYQIQIRLLQLTKSLLTRHLQAGILLPSLMLAFVQKVSPDVALSLLATIKSDSKNANLPLFTTFAQNCINQPEKNLKAELKVVIEKGVSTFIKEIFLLAVTANSCAGYKSALSLLQAHFADISRSLLWQGQAKRSQLNALLSEQSFYVGWIIFANLANGCSLSASLKPFFQHLLSNDIVKFELLSRCFEPYPHIGDHSSSSFVWGQTLSGLKFLGNFFEEEKYSYFVWDAVLKRLPTLPASLREECLPLVEEIFLKAYRKENLRKVVMATVLSNYIAAGVIVGPRNKLQALFETAADELFVGQEMIQYHYNCYLQMVTNALASDILSPLYFDKIMLHSRRKDPKMRNTCSLMLLYGGTLTSRNQRGGVVTPQVVTEQANYLRFLIERKFIVPPRFQQSLPPSGKLEIEFNSRLLAILFSFGITQATKLLAMIEKLLSASMEFGEWRCIVNCYTPENYSLAVREEAILRSRVNQLLITKLIHYCKIGLISHVEEKFFIDKLK